jgi:hypothetical protein
MSQPRMPMRPSGSAPGGGGDMARKHEGVAGLNLKLTRRSDLCKVAAARPLFSRQQTRPVDSLNP